MVTAGAFAFEFKDDVTGLDYKVTDDNDLVLIWSMPEGVSTEGMKYNVYFNGSETPVAMVETPTYTHNGIRQGLSYSFTVEPVYTDGQTGKLSENIQMMNGISQAESAEVMLEARNAGASEARALTPRYSLRAPQRLSLSGATISGWMGVWATISPAGTPSPSTARIR